MSYTKGQWKPVRVFINNQPDQWHVKTGEWGAGSIAICDTEEHARLIASAPVLLEALKRIKDCALVSPQVLLTVIHDQTLAISQAEGDSP